MDKLAYIYTPAGDTLPSNFPTDGGGGGGGGGGTTNYNDLSNKPTLNGVALQGNKTGSDFGIPSQSAVQNAVATATAADTKATSALTKASEALTKATSALTTAEGVEAKTDEALTKATSALTTAEGVEAKADDAVTRVAALETKVAGMPDTPVSDEELDEDWG